MNRGKAMEKERRRIIIDFEVLSKAGFWMCAMKDYKTQKEHIIINNREELLRVYNKNKESVWIGYNIRGYDQWILKAIIADIDPCIVSQKLIEQKIKVIHYPPYVTMRSAHLNKYIQRLSSSVRIQISTALPSSVKSAHTSWPTLCKQSNTASPRVS